MIEKFDIAGYCRISVDEELNRDNTSIENQKAIIEDYVRQKFPGSSLTFFEDRDRSGYTFEQREGYQKMRKQLLSHKLDILIVKDFSRFSRRNSRGLVELEDLRDYGVRIISIGDGIDFPNDDDWLKIQFQFLINEMPVTDTSKKVRSVVKRRQHDGKWICAAPYGYIINARQEFEIVPTEAEIVRKIFRLYQSGMGYMKIANTLTDDGIPTPRMSERQRKEAEGKEYKRKVNSAWSIVTVQGILENDFYIGTMRSSKYTRKKINGKDVKLDESEHIVIENHHQAIIGYREFATVRALMESRSKGNYRGQKKYDNVYSGFLECGDCGSPMFAMSRADLKDAYRCGTYHRRGLKGCTSHHIRVDKLDEILKTYLQMVKDNSAEMLTQLNADLAKEAEDMKEQDRSEENLEEILLDLQGELKATKRQRIRDIMKHPDQEEMLEETYDELEDDLTRRIAGIQNQIDLTVDRRNTIIRVNRTAKLALEVFDDILNKDKLDRSDLQLIIERIRVYEDHVDVQLKADIDSLLRCGTLAEDMEEAANFDSGIMDNLSVTLVSKAKCQKDKVYDVNIISDGDPLEIYTATDGEVIFKKYSPVGELSEFAGQYADVIARISSMPTLICDTDHVIAAAGVSKREYLERRISSILESYMDNRKSYAATNQTLGNVQPIEGIEHDAAVIYPIIASGDVMGAVVLLTGENAKIPTGVEIKLAQSAAAFLGKQMEN
ncbi:stage V sporulation T C-terminal domain-containing protein [Ruminococcus sp.]|uniref:stage V sporulation T C-terminal domain-containing protein n=1 Tax=Ruminococcus sp. TaxID=41978 RepID=UPI002E7A682E|nr:stage V sporulation T C-terminal domain-containing protein [Ruminococcus sp.]MEE1261677.1 stage V sporulation T C-terminal domain-containing protein [Ruminococcus sp.]